MLPTAAYDSATAAHRLGHHYPMAGVPDYEPAAERPIGRPGPAGYRPNCCST